MKRIPTCRSVDRTNFRSTNDPLELGPRSAGQFLAVFCLFFGGVIAAFAPATLEQRIGNLLLFSLIPAIGFYVAGHIISRLLILSRALCEKIAACYFWLLARLMSHLLTWVNSTVSNLSIRCLTMHSHLLSNVSALSKNVCRSIRGLSRRGCVAFIGILCFLIRGTARFAIWMQTSRAFYDTNITRSRWHHPLFITIMLVTAFGLGWCGGESIWRFNVVREDLDVAAAIEPVVERIIRIESDGNPNAKNTHSSATGLGQFIDETWLRLINTHRPDLAKDRSQGKILELRRDPKVAREITVRFTEHNAVMLRKRGLPVTPGTLYLAHFAGGAGAVAILAAREDADAASVIADAGRTKREKIVRANPFLERFSVADIRSWADRKMR